MSWAKFDDEYEDHPKVVAGGTFVYAFHVRSILWCARNLTDGLLPRKRAHTIAYDVVAGLDGAPSADALLERAIALRLIDAVDDDYAVHDYLDYNPTREKVLREREKAKERMQKLRGGRK